jgi:GDP-mannose 6-dehydrogenase
MRSDLREVINESEVIVIGKRDEEFRAAAEGLGNGRVAIDLVRLIEPADSREAYQGICW